MGFPDRAKTIVVVEDEQNMRELLKEFLTGEGFIVHGAGNGEEALRIIRELPQIDLMLLDIMMPGIDGRQLLHYIRTSGVRRFPIIIVSALKEDDDILASYLEGSDHYITKPFDLDDLLNAVQYFIAARTDA